MEFKNKYIKCFSKEKSEELKRIGYIFLHESNGVFWFEENNKITLNFSNSDILKDVKFSSWINL